MTNHNTIIHNVHNNNKGPKNVVFGQQKLCVWAEINIICLGNNNMCLGSKQYYMSGQQQYVSGQKKKKCL
jgi:hypothetical protein